MNDALYGVVLCSLRVTRQVSHAMWRIGEKKKQKAFGGPWHRTPTNIENFARDAILLPSSNVSCQY